MTKEQQVVQDMLDGNKYLIEQSINNAPYDKCMVGLITQVNDDNTYSVKISEETYTNIPSLFTGLNKNDTVKVFSPQNQFSQLFILGKYNMELSGGGITSVNGYSGVVVLNASDVGALPSSTVIPTKTSGLTNDSNYVSDNDYVHTDNNFTLILKNKLDGIQSRAEVNVNADWNSTSGDSQILNKPIKLSQFTNDSGFIINTASNLTNYYTKSLTYSKEEVNTLIGNIPTLDILVIDVLPTSNISTRTIYLVLKSTTENDDVYDEYMHINNQWEHIGNTQIDLSNYYTITQIDNLLNNKVDKVSGKGLSTNDFTDSYKSKVDSSLQSIPSGYVTDTEMKSYAQPIDDYGVSLSLGGNGNVVNLKDRNGDIISTITVQTGVIEWQ